MLAVLLLLANSLSPWGHAEQQSLLDKARQSVVSVTAYDRAGAIKKQGFGLFISDAGDIIVSSDIVEGAARVDILTAEGKTFKLSRLIANDAEFLMVLFQVEMPRGTAKPVKVAQVFPETGAQVGVIVAGGASAPSLTLTSVKSRKVVAKWDELEVASQLPADSLGNPVFDMNGEFIGVVAVQTEGTHRLTIQAGERLSKMVGQLLAAARGSDSDPKTRPGATGAALSTKTILQVGPVLTGRAVKRVEPAYPRSARDYGIRGTVVIGISIDETGSVVNASVARGNYQRLPNVTEAEARRIIPDLEGEAVAAARKWKFAPTLLDGVPVRVFATLTFNFKM